MLGIGSREQEKVLSHYVALFLKEGDVVRSGTGIIGNITLGTGVGDRRRCYLIKLAYY